jgi:hypothetical protein
VAAAARPKNPILVKNVKKLQRATEAKKPAASTQRAKSTEYKPPILQQILDQIKIVKEYL